MKTRSEPFILNIFPRETISWGDFVKKTPKNSIALDGYVLGGPRFDLKSGHFNYDHHEGVVREVTMSTAMQIYFAIKGGLIQSLIEDGDVNAHIYLNDTDQDASLAAWILLNYKKFEGSQSIPHINRLLHLNDKWDITGGAFPMNLDDEVVRQHNWVFEPYTNLRKSGALAIASEQVLRDNLDAIFLRLNQLMMGQAKEKTMDTRHKILYDSPKYKIIDEIGGNEARYYLYSQGLSAFVSKVATRSDGNFVYTIGKKSQYIKFPIRQIYEDLNKAEGLDPSDGWNGSDIIGGSSRKQGSCLDWQKIRDIVDERLFKDGLI